MRLIIISNTVHNFFADSAIYWSGEEKLSGLIFFPYLIPNQVKASFLKFLITCLIHATGLIKLDKSLVLPSQAYKMIV